MKISKTLIVLVLSITSLFFISAGSDEIGWKYLKGIDIIGKFNPETENFDNEIIFPKTAKKRVGKTIQLTGYLSETTFSKDKKKYECCFGIVNPVDEMVTLDLKDSVYFSPDTKIAVEGILKLNYNDNDSCNYPCLPYILENVHILGAVPKKK